MRKRETCSLTSVPVLVLVPILCCLGCSAGTGDGEVVGRLRAEPCGESDETYSLEPDFFAARDFEDGLEIRVQRGSDLEGLSDGLSVFVRDASAVKRTQLGLPLDVSQSVDAPVRVGFFLNKTCPGSRTERPFNLEAVSGSIVFNRIYAPRVNGSTRIEASFSNLEFADPQDADDRNATLQGSFSFSYSRGAPAQRFP